MKIKTGIGYDVHKLVEGKTLTVGGIEIPHIKGSLGHSDGDVLIHAICDALLGAANLRDIGFHFPDTSAEYKGIDSKILLKKVVELVRKMGFEISNIDSTIVLQKPKIKEYIPKMKKALAETMQIPIEDVSVKATTTEKLGFTGREEGISAYAAVLIVKNSGYGLGIL
ncbi:MAG: 2-C-methyl-D-erythritol 2,4-cyclodiphosphate synthase [Bacteroidales bacterium]|nr:2-C-methyl-D-erythritol 2,4-cyclodiphosphate synthase [Bacteroidales bacterium]